MSASPSAPLARALAEVARCCRCGACSGVCPVYGALPREELSARGKLQIISCLDQGLLIPRRGLAELLGRCLLCGRCTANCPNQSDAAQAIALGRQALAQAVGAPAAKRLLLERALPKPERLELLAAAGRLAQPLLRALPRLSGLRLRLPGLSGLERLPALAARPFLADAPIEVPGPAGAPRLGLFVGCLTNYLRPELATKAVRLLSRRYTVVIPPGQGCCGLPALAAGLAAPAAELGQDFRRLFNAARVERVVTLCASCAHGLAVEGPRLAPPEEQEAAQELAHRVVEISQVLAGHPRLLAGLGSVGAPAALHHPCHLRQGQAPRPETAAMLSAAGVELAQMAGADQCCGGGGLFSLSQPQLSQTIFAPRNAALAASGAAVLATSCSGCYLQWRRGLPAQVKVVHPIELVGD